MGACAAHGSAGCLFCGTEGGRTKACAAATVRVDDTGVQLVHRFRIVRSTVRRADSKTGCGGTVSTRVDSGIR